jgi:NAD(P)H-dependent FMN reductase
VANDKEDEMNIMVILGSSREGRRGEHAARWVAATTAEREGIQVDFVDTRELHLPFYDEVSSIESLEGNFRHPEGKAWGERVAKADAFIVVFPEYNRGIPAILKNAIDYAWAGWNYKPISYVSYSNGPWGGTRATEQMKLVSIGVRALPLPSAVHIPLINEAFDDQGTLLNDKLTGSIDRLLNELLMIANKLKS